MIDNFLDSVHETGTDPAPETDPNLAGGGTPPPATPTPTPQAAEPPPVGSTAGIDPIPPVVATEPVKTILPHEVFGDEYKDKDWTVAGADVKAKLQKVTEYEQEIATLRATPPSYANETVAKYDAWIRNGGVEDFTVFNTVANFKQEMNDIDALVAKEIIENPSLIGSEQYIKDRILKQYPTASTDEEPLDPGQVKYNQGLLAGEAAKAKEFIKAQGAKMQVQQSAPPVNQAELLATRTGAWTSAGDHLQSKLKVIPVVIPVEKDGKMTYEKIVDYVLPEAEVAAEVRELTNFYSRHVDVNEETLRELEIDARKNILNKHIPFLVKAAVDQERTRTIEEYDKKYAGVVLPDPGSAPPASFAPSSNDEHINSVI